MRILGSVDTEKNLIGQRIDITGLYFYNARYYDPSIGRFISADTITPDFANPQTLNRYSYVYNNPLRYTDPTGHCPWCVGAIVGAGSYVATKVVLNVVTYRQEGLVNALKSHALEGFSVRDLAEATVIGAATSGVGSLSVVKTVLKEATPIVTGAAGAEAQYLVDVAEGQTAFTPKGAAIVGLLGAATAAVEVKIKGDQGLQAAGAGFVAAAGQNLVQEVTPWVGNPSELIAVDLSVTTEDDDVWWP